MCIHVSIVSQYLFKVSILKACKHIIFGAEQRKVKWKEQQQNYYRQNNSAQALKIKNKNKKSSNNITAINSWQIDRRTMCKLKSWISKQNRIHATSSSFSWQIWAYMRFVVYENEYNTCVNAFTVSLPAYTKIQCNISQT